MAQSKAYFTATHIADSLYQIRHYYEAGQLYNRALATVRGKGDWVVWDRYMAARCWVLSGFGDTALIHLEKLVYINRYCPMHIMRGDPDFSSLQNNRRYLNVIDTAEAISAANEVKRKQTKDLFEPDLAAVLDSIQKADQYYRLQINDTEKQFGRESDEVRNLWKKIRYYDSLNLKKVTQILDTRGWLGPEIVHSGSETLFLVIQHSDLNTQLKYLPMMREATANGKLDKGSLAMLEDRVLLRQNQKQIYGTQISRDPVTGERFVAPLADPDNVDKRRLEAGMGSLADYVSYWDLSWDVESYKKEMAEREKREAK